MEMRIKIVKARRFHPPRLAGCSPEGSLLTSDPPKDGFAVANRCLPRPPAREDFRSSRAKAGPPELSRFSAYRRHEFANLGRKCFLRFGRAGLARFDHEVFHHLLS
jgi:hypothetical protein